MNDVRQFSESWQATALGLVEGLKAAGLISAQDWANALGSEIAALGQESEEDYYRAVLQALEKLAMARGLASAPAMAQRAQDWRAAYLATPHGKPVHLSTAVSPAK